MNDELKKKANAMFYDLTKTAARSDFSEFLDGCGLTYQDWQQIKQEITIKTGIDGFYI